MLRQALFTDDDPDFRWRGHDVSRLEGLADAVFGFAITLLVVSLEVPRSINQLLLAMRGFVAFAVCFAVLFRLWKMHYEFFRRYGLQDGMTHRLNAVYLLVVLFYIYPLKFMFEMMFNPLMGIPRTRLPDGELAFSFTSADQPAQLMLVYCLGAVAVFGVMVLLHLHALRMRERLELNALEIAITRSRIVGSGSMVVVALLAIPVAFWGNPEWAGAVFFLAFPAGVLNRRSLARSRARLRAATAAVSQPDAA